MIHTNGFGKVELKIAQIREIAAGGQKIMTEEDDIHGYRVL